MADRYQEWRDFYAKRVSSWMSLEELRAECGKLTTTDGTSPELLLIHAMHALEECVQRDEAMPQQALEALKAENEALRAEVERLKGENANLKTVMIAAAEEIHQHWDAHCDDEGYGPTNLMRRLEKGIPSQYGYTAGAFAELRRRVDTAEARVAELERFHAVVRTAMQIHVIDEDAIEWINQRLTFLRGEEA